MHSSECCHYFVDFVTTQGIAFHKHLDCSSFIWQYIFSVGRQSPSEDQPDSLGASGIDPPPMDPEPLIPIALPSGHSSRIKGPKRLGRGTASNSDSVFLEPEDLSSMPPRPHETHGGDSNRLSIPVKQPRPHSAGRTGSHGRHGPLLSVPEHSSSLASSKPANHSSMQLVQPVVEKSQTDDDKPLMSFMSGNSDKVLNSQQGGEVANANFKSSLKKLDQSDLQELENLSFANPVFNGGARPKQRSSCPQIGSREKDFIRKENGKFEYIRVYWTFCISFEA